MKRRATKRRCVPEHEREAIALEIRELLKARDATGHRLWTQSSLGEHCGGLPQQMIYSAQEPDGVGPSVRDGILRLTGLTVEQLLGKHEIDPGPEAITHRFEDVASLKSARLATTG